MTDEMWAYVDESGCMGMKLEEGSSLTFTVVTVIFSSKEVATQCYNRIEELKSELKPRKEFSFSGCNDDQRVGFFRAMCRFDFNYFGIVFDKTKLMGFNRPFLHWAVLAQFAQHAERINKAKVVFDKTGSSDFRKMMCKRLKEDLNRECDREVISGVKAVGSHCNNLLQLADMVCGAVARSHNTERVEPDKYREMIRAKEWTISVYPSA
jgi:hypothetical protein